MLDTFLLNDGKQREKDKEKDFYEVGILYYYVIGHIIKFSKIFLINLILLNMQDTMTE